MRKITLIGPVPQDDPMFSSGPELFSRPESSASSRNTPASTARATLAKSAPASDSPETEADGKDLGEMRRAGSIRTRCLVKKRKSYSQVMHTSLLNILCTTFVLAG